jgi:hypothetical protein
MHIKRKVEKYVPHKFGKIGKSTIYANNSLYIFMCIWRDLPQQKIQGHYAAGAPPICYVPMFPWKYFFSTKRERNKEIKKRVHEA